MPPDIFPSSNPGRQGNNISEVWRNVQPRNNSQVFINRKATGKHYGNYGSPKVPPYNSKVSQRMNPNIELRNKEVIKDHRIQRHWIGLNNWGIVVLRQNGNITYLSEEK